MKLPKLPAKKTKDDYQDVAAQVLELEIVTHNLPNIPPRVKDALMQELIIYIEGYGHVVHRHAYELGRDSNDPNLEPEEEG